MLPLCWSVASDFTVLGILRVKIQDLAPGKTFFFSFPKRAHLIKRENLSTSSCDVEFVTWGLFWSWGGSVLRRESPQSRVCRDSHREMPRSQPCVLWSQNGAWCHGHRCPTIPAWSLAVADTVVHTLSSEFPGLIPCPPHTVPAPAAVTLSVRFCICRCFHVCLHSCHWWSEVFLIAFCLFVSLFVRMFGFYCLCSIACFTCCRNSWSFFGVRCLYIFL